ncbi:uncharacterized protein LOC113005396 isoform X2 [Solenopsis invicta]|uniref:uncharacterized protein LOC113005396 isoform X2 n=1 Tax=Solenopsis invicta TaxID=13686 RepID=UPI00193E8FD7|nr:uncharacterized protein LOC113005396 isoform X2 [Solenopsis invicta]
MCNIHETDASCSTSEDTAYFRYKRTAGIYCQKKWIRLNTKYLQQNATKFQSLKRTYKSITDHNKKSGTIQKNRNIMRLCTRYLVLSHGFNHNQ